MYLKKIKLINFRKFSTEDNVIEFVSSNFFDKKNSELKDINTDFHTIETPQIDIATDTTLIVGKNNAGKTTIISALDHLLNFSINNVFGENDFNFRYLSQYLNHVNTSTNISELVPPSIEFVITIALEENSSDRISNLIPFMLVDDVDDSELDIFIKYEVNDLETFRLNIQEFLKKPEKVNLINFLKLLHNIDFSLNYYDKNGNKINKDFKLSNLIELRCIKANHIKNDFCLTEAFNKIISYRYEHTFKDEKKKIVNDLDEINTNLTKNIRDSHTKTISDVLEKLMTMEKMGVNLTSDITFEKLMKDLVKYEYVEGSICIPENQFGLGYTNLIMIIAAIMDYMEKYPDTSFNSKINLISIEEPETFMHPQMQELFIKNINEAIQVLFDRKNKNINSQILITTHSSHILNSKIHSANTFNNICYLYENNNNAAIVNLNNSKIMPISGDNEKSSNFKFLKKHIKYKVSELFFSDAAIFVEGFAESIILPFYIENHDGLNKHYISIFNIDGAHGYLYKNLILALGIPSLIVTDIDIKRDENEKNEFKQIDCLINRETTNITIENLYGKKDLSSISQYVENKNLYLTYQGKINGYFPTSFEEALILTNYDNIIINDILEDIKPQIYKNIVGDNKDYKCNISNSYKWQIKLGNEKGEFANKLLYRIISTDSSEKIPRLPNYIANGLEWIKKMLTVGTEK